MGVRDMAIHKRGSGRVYRRGPIWWIQYYIHGVLMRESTSSEDKEEAKRQLSVKVGDVAAGRAVAPKRTTIADLCALVLADNRLRNLRDAQHTEMRYQANVEPLLGNLLASRFGPAQVRQYVTQRREAGVSDATINRELAIVRRGFKLGAQEDPPLVFRQPAIPKLEENNVRQGFLAPEQYEKLLAELPANLKALFVCGYHVGARKNELRRLQWPQVDFESGLIRLSGEQTKNKCPRILPIYGDMRRWLEQQQDMCPEGSPWVFHGSHGYPVDNHLNGWKGACERAGVPGLLFHDLRRSAIRNMKKARLQDLECMRISGHKTRAVFDRYNIIDEDDLADAGKQLEAYTRKRKQERAARLRRVK